MLKKNKIELTLLDFVNYNIILKTMQCCLSIRRLKSKGPIIPTVNENVEKQEYSYTADKNVFTVGKQLAASLKNLNIYLPYTIATLLLGL